MFDYVTRAQRAMEAIDGKYDTVEIFAAHLRGVIEDAIREAFEFGRECGRKERQP